MQWELMYNEHTKTFTWAKPDQPVAKGCVVVKKYPMKWNNPFTKELHAVE